MTSALSEVSYDFSGKTAIVTGAGGTLGSETVRQLALSGATVLAVDFDAEALQTLVEALAAEGLTVEVHVADVRDPNDVEAYAQVGFALGGGGIDLFFNNAGIEGAVAPIETIDLDDFRRLLDVNVIGVLNGMAKVLPGMREGGAIVNTASVGALRGSVGAASYVASKHAVLGLTRSAAMEVASRGIRVNAICPGPISGRMMRSLDDQRHELFHVPTGAEAGRQYARPAAVARVVLFLLSDAASLIKGHAIVVEVGN